MEICINDFQFSVERYNTLSPGIGYTKITTWLYVVYNMVKNNNATTIGTLPCNGPMTPVMSNVSAMTLARRLFCPFLNVTLNASIKCFRLKKNLIRVQYDFFDSSWDFTRLVSCTHRWAIHTLMKHNINAIVYTPVNPSLRYSIPDIPVPMGRAKATTPFTMPILNDLFFSCVGQNKRRTYENSSFPQ